MLGMDGSAIEFLLVTCLNQPPERAKLVAAALQIASFIAIIVGLVMFAEWRFISFEQMGCKAYCNCTARFANMTYVLP